MKDRFEKLEHVLGKFNVNQDIIEAGIEINTAENEQQLLAAARRFQKVVDLALAVKHQKQYHSRIETALAGVAE